MSALPHSLLALLLLFLPSLVGAQELSALLARASERNRLPPRLQGYQAQVETEISIIARREEGTEAVAAIEQVASRVEWQRGRVFEQTVVGYRNQQVGANVSLLTLFETGWLNPVLYGNRLRIQSSTGGRGGRRSGGARGRRNSADTLPAIHPLAEDRDRYYRFSGGDTVVVIRAGDRVIPIVQLRVTPRADPPRADVSNDLVLFEGDLALDASRGALVRMRGHFIRRGAATRSPIRGALGDAVAYVEYENAERLGEYWLPAVQRIELQAGSPALGDARAVVRIVSRFREMTVHERTAADVAPDVSAAAVTRRFRVLPADSLTQYSGWRTPVGALSAGLHADDFEDIAPDRWRTTGPPRFDLSPPRPSDLFHYNRVEGVFTGIGGKWALRDAAPGVTVRATAGYAWGERTVRGRVQLERKRGATLLELRAGRSLDNTNDFRTPFDSGNTFGALFGSVDPYDYVSRTGATVAVVRQLGTALDRRRALVRAELGVADDRWRAATQTRGLAGEEPFRENRGVDEGTYLRSALLMEWHPDRAPEFVSPGWSARAQLEHGRGALDYTRVEGRVTWRKPLGPFTWLTRGDVGVVTGHGRDGVLRIPPQQLFELGKYQNLPGYTDKQFAGSRAAVLRSSVQYTTPWWRAPIRVTPRLWLPGLSPGVSVGVQSGWADAPTPEARDAVNRLDTRPPNPLALYLPIATPTGRVRATVSAGLRLFGNGLFLGATRPVDQAAPWRALVGFGQVW